MSEENLFIHFYERKPIILTCDASEFGIGSVLGYQLEKGIGASIAYNSGTINPTERRYSQIDKEALAIIQGAMKFRNCLYGHKFEIRIFHKPLLGLLATNKAISLMLSPRMQKGATMLNSYDYALVYRAARENANADGFSDLPKPSLTNKEIAPIKILLLEALK